MANAVVKQAIHIELENQEDIEAFTALISEVCSAYSPPPVVGFKQKPKFEVPENIGEFAMSIGYQIGLFVVEEEEVVL